MQYIREEEMFLFVSEECEKLLIHFYILSICVRTLNM